MKITREPWGTLPDGSSAELFTLSCEDGFAVQVTSFGGIVTSIKAPDRSGACEEITLGFDTLDEYVNSRFYFGAAVGRFGNRIAGGRFTLKGEEYSLARNNGPNCLHGGVENTLDRKNWQVTPFTGEGEAGLILTAFSPDGEEGFPGNLSVTMTYTVTEKHELTFDYKAVTDRDTPVNLTNHSYFNLGGITRGDVRDHRVSLNCPWYLPVDDVQIPTGEVLSVRNTPMDFLEEHTVGERIDSVDGGGYDHCYVLAPGEGVRPFAEVHDPASGRCMEVETDQPGVQFYTGNFLDNIPGRSGQTYNRNWGLCLETQLFPDCINQPHFPSPVLKPGQVYSHTSVYRFSVK